MKIWKFDEKVKFYMKIKKSFSLTMMTLTKFSHNFTSGTSRDNKKVIKTCQLLKWMSYFTWFISFNEKKKSFPFFMQWCNWITDRINKLKLKKLALIINPRTHTTCKINDFQLTLMYELSMNRINFHLIMD